jgi:bifunctional ADP-heptose synthase (sugar kinase/adenylyltransferase)
MNLSKQQLAQTRVLVVGDAMLDRYWHGAVERISPEAPVPVVKVTREEERIGAAANVAYNVAMLGAQASFVGVIGDDAPGRRLEALMREHGHQTPIWRATPGYRPPSSFVSLGGNNNCCVWILRASPTTKPWLPRPRLLPDWS